MKVLLATEKPFAKTAVDGIKKVLDTANYELVLLEKYTDKQQLLDAVAEANAMIIRSDKVDKEVIDAAKKLKIVVRAGAGYDNVDLDAATKANVCVMNTPGQNSNAVAELAIGMLIYGVRNFYNGTSGTELKGKKLGIHAYGNVGKHVARIAKGLGMEVYAYSRSLAKNPELAKVDGITAVQTAEELYEKSDIISLHIPANAETKGSINKALISRMPENGIVVNTARKEVINEDELLDYMVNHPKFKFITDIKPDNAQVLSEKCPEQFFTTPKKTGAQTAEANINAGIAAAEQIVGFLKDGIETFRVN